jgi:hypothetical protein
MKKQYIAPSQLVVNLMGVGIIAASDNVITDTPDVTINPGTVSGGDAGGADVKGSTNVWSEEW